MSGLPGFAATMTWPVLSSDFTDPAVNWIVSGVLLLPSTVGSGLSDPQATAETSAPTTVAKRMASTDRRIEFGLRMSLLESSDRR